jgi:large subunit ribosomal protein L14
LKKACQALRGAKAQPTFLIPIENSGAKHVQCIQIKNKSKRKKAGSVGNNLILTVKDAHPTAKIKTKLVSLGVITSVAKKRCRYDGTTIEAQKNLLVMTNKQGLPQATRITNYIPLEFHRNAFSKLRAMATFLL